MAGVIVVAVVLCVAVVIVLAGEFLRHRNSGALQSRFGLDRANAVAGVIARIAEVWMWIAVAIRVLMVAAFVVVPDSYETSSDGSLVSGIGPIQFVLDGTLLDFQSRFVRFSGESVDLWPVLLTGVGGVVVSVGYAWLFHQMAGLCNDLRHWNPQCEDVVPIWTSIAGRMRAAGRCLVAMPMVVVVVMVCVGLAGYPFHWNLGTSALLVMLGILALTLGRVFEYGMGLQREVDGLL